MTKLEVRNEEQAKGKSVNWQASGSAHFPAHNKHSNVLFYMDSDHTTQTSYIK